MHSSGLWSREPDVDGSLQLGTQTPLSAGRRNVNAATEEGMTVHGAHLGGCLSVNPGAASLPHRRDTRRR